ncbi:MAG: CAP domain-containing protein [Acidobacteria bacterium]|nr:CAP domain-containing protein [Acidobacteriota bacterium]
MKILGMIYFCLAILLVTNSAVAQSARQAERQIFDSTNRERRSRGLPALVWNDDLALAARQHAEAMAQSHTLSHQLPGEASLPTRARKAGVKFTSLSENVAVGTTAEDIAGQWIKSSAHRENLLDPEMTATGVGVAERDGKLFAAEDFAKVRP